MASVTENLAAFVEAQAEIGTPFVPSVLTGQSIYQFDAGPQRIPLFIRTGQLAMRDQRNPWYAPPPVERYRFDQIEFHGKGTLYVRLYVDGAWITDSIVTMAETPAKDRRFGVPRGTRGYTPDLEIAGDVEYLRAIEFTYRAMSSTS